nr:hypothetical protein CFP56_64809 [Quercus suber]
MDMRATLKGRAAREAGRSRARDRQWHVVAAARVHELLGGGTWLVSVAVQSPLSRGALVASSSNLCGTAALSYSSPSHTACAGEEAVSVPARDGAKSRPCNDTLSCGKEPTHLTDFARAMEPIGSSRRRRRIVDVARRPGPDVAPRYQGKRASSWRAEASGGTVSGPPLSLSILGGLLTDARREAEAWDAVRLLGREATAPRAKTRVTLTDRRRLHALAQCSVRRDRAVMMMMMMMAFRGDRGTDIVSTQAIIQNDMIIIQNLHLSRTSCPGPTQSQGRSHYQLCSPGRLCLSLQTMVTRGYRFEKKNKKKSTKK